MRRSLLAALLLIPALALSGCGSDSASDTASESPAATAAGDGVSADGVTVSGEPGSEPTISIDTAATPPDQLVVKEITAGDGPAIGPNSLVTVQYVGSSWSTGEVFQSSWATGEAEFPIQGVIPGWQEGLQGATQGSRVLLIIPPDLAYGSEPPPGSGIAPDETLAFVVDVVKVSS
ncbi:MAG: FKBP-type peptidyl-prolyl cis-trans isomerase [Actinobacteria bacterium]|nr:FKBP-type peptidyl-prolyl cis-trans isomerase [Actinomycetota bacterium]MCO5300904.1 FKBP-type peptidyl-prolyl cis-trans isomerase [Candidatus Nanopelagicales bacterium]MCB9428618.1 FKBP-type peptidyl-prolyl cis-trans isomerase [Actinomycetota bacterium]HPE11592.1 FKBP-type peptidyl-prolyl cis-trans isomerase [Actinomycetota bacterium]HPJ20318.1 FKBP-type peptidyl-prolyl cis-trans isomerase [Actinomycetota bacterium]